MLRRDEGSKYCQINIYNGDKAIYGDDTVVYVDDNDDTSAFSVPLSSPVTDNHLKLLKVSLPLRPGANVSRLARRPLWQRPLSL